MFEDSGIIRRIKRKGEGYSNPNEGATVEGESCSWEPVLHGVSKMQSPGKSVGCKHGSAVMRVRCFLRGLCLVPRPASARAPVPENPAPSSALQGAHIHDIKKLNIYLRNSFRFSIHLIASFVKY